MYRLNGPNLVIYIPLVIIGLIIVTFIPNYFPATRYLSFISLAIGELGLSFIPVLVFYPKATLQQTLLLASIYFSTIAIICFTSWGFYSVGLINTFAFAWNEDKFLVNTYSLFIANIFSLACLILCFKLVYDEELAKESHLKSKNVRQAKKFGFGGFSNPLLRRPTFDTRTNPTPISTHKEIKHKKSSTSEDFLFENELERPFDFEPESESSVSVLPEESSGKLHTDKEEESLGNFFNDEITEQQVKKSDSSTDVEDNINPFTKESEQESTFTPPKDIKDELNAIFEQYSSLNAIKKLTTSKSTDKTEKKTTRKPRRPYVLPKDAQDMSVEIESTEGEIHEASFRQISEKETIEEIKHDLMEEINKELLKKLEEKTSQIKDSVGKTEVLKEDIIESIKNIKQDLLESLKEEMKPKHDDMKIAEPKKEEKTSEEEVEIEEDNTELESILNHLKNTEPNITGAVFLNPKAKVLAECWAKGKRPIIQNEQNISLLQFFNNTSNEIKRTGQENLFNILLESEEGTMVLTKLENKLLTVYTEGKGEIFTGKILRAVSNVEDSL